MILDACKVAIKENRNLEVNIVAKATAPHAVPTDKICMEIIKAMGLDYPQPIKNVRILYQGRVSKDEWYSTLSDTDIGVFLSTEEGLHMFVVESWLMGIECIIPEPRAYPDFDKLGKGISTVTTVSVPSGGTGVYNDSFKTSIRYPKYGEAVSIIAKHLLSTRKETWRTPQDEYPITLDHNTYIKILNMEDNQDDIDIKVNVLDHRCELWVQHITI